FNPATGEEEDTEIGFPGADHHIAEQSAPMRIAMGALAFGALHTFLYNKWYFDEAIDFLIVRPSLAIGRFANRVFERFVVDGLVSGTEDVVSGGGRLVRVVQSGFVRSYALLLIVGFAGLALYFLLSSS
ncbi:MAG TPA: hypothetical protein VMR96_10670, partial [Solirubrobacterales bacterium]|nr:hypothetical protein [Solirubrobacterales bacterium]